MLELCYLQNLQIWFFFDPYYFITIIIAVLLYHRVLNKRSKKFKKTLKACLDEFQPSPLIERAVDVNDVFDRKLVNSTYINLMARDFLSIGKCPGIRKNAARIIRKYGVGTCGPRSFFGTTDKHLILEKKLAKFYNKEAALIYSYGPLVISSVVQCYANKNDVVFMDVCCNRHISSGVRSFKGTCVYFKHNDSNDLSIILESDLKTFNSGFLILEGIYEHDGMICDLPSFIKVAKRFKLRIILDESLSLGVLGVSGHGIIEYYNEHTDDIDIICGTLDYAFGAIGGFCAASFEAMHSQNIISQSYVYSASLSVYLVQSITLGLNYFNKRAIALQLMSRETQILLEQLDKFNVFSHYDSPFKVFTPKIAYNLSQFQERLVQFCKNIFNVLMEQDERGIYFYCNYDVFNNKEEKEKVFMAIEAMAELVASYQVEIH